MGKERDVCIKDGQEGEKKPEPGIEKVDKTNKMTRLTHARILEQ